MWQIVYLGQVNQSSDYFMASNLLQEAQRSALVSEYIAVQKPKESGGKPVSDQQLDAFVIVDGEDKSVGRVEDGDVVIIFNFRADRVVELSKALDLDKFDKFDRKRRPKVVCFPSIP